MEGCSERCTPRKDGEEREIVSERDTFSFAIGSGMVSLATENVKKKIQKKIKWQN